MNLPERLRPELDEEVTRKLRDAIKDLYDREGIQISPQRLVNIILGSVEVVEFVQNIRIVIKQLPPGDSRKTIHRSEVRKKSNWMANLK